MKQSITQPLARHKELTGPFDTEPYECAWASEAIFFIRIQSVEEEDLELVAYPQISADGIHWVDDGSEFPPMRGTGVWFLRLTHFGGWLRLRCETRGAPAKCDVMIHLVLKG